MSNWEKYLKDIYLDPSHPASFGSLDHLYKIVKKEGKHKISHSQIKKWIQKQESYSLNKGLKRKFERGRVIVEGIDDQFDIDLASLIYYADDNDGYKYLLVVIDIFSHYGWVQPLKDKTANEIVKAFDKVLQERFIKTLKSKIFKYMVEKNSPRYIDVLPKIVQSYNRTWYSGIRSEPINVNKTNEKQLWWQMYWPKEPYDPNRKKHEIKYAFKIGDRVRTTFLHRPFQREYDTRWTGEILKITRRFMRQGQPIYKLADWYNKPVKGTFYQKELQKIEVRDDDMFKVEKVIKYKGRGNKREALVRWLGWPKQFDSWIPITQLNKK